MPSKGLSPKTFKGLNDKRMAKGGGNFDRLKFDQGDTLTLQFLEDIDEFLEYEIHVFRDGNRWNYVPCAGDDCPLCADDDPDIAKTTYRFCCNVYSFRDKKVQILEGPKDLAGRIAQRYKSCQKRGKSFQKQTYEVSKYATTPVSYEVESGDERPVRTEGMKKLDLLKYVVSNMERYFGDDMPTSSGKKKKEPSASSLDDDWDDEDEEDDFDTDEFSKEELLEMGPGELLATAKSVGVKVKKVTKENRKKVISAILKNQ